MARRKRFVDGFKVVKVYVQPSEYDEFERVCGESMSDWARHAMLAQLHDRGGAPILQQSGSSESGSRKPVQTAVARPAANQGVDAGSEEPGQGVERGVYYSDTPLPRWGHVPEVEGSLGDAYASEPNGVIENAVSGSERGNRASAIHIDPDSDSGADERLAEVEAGGKEDVSLDEQSASGRRSSVRKGRGTLGKAKGRQPVPSDVRVRRTCMHGVERGFNCWQCGGMAQVKS